jgi:DNA invertase Pin-like site-specific DNA recombinase
LLDQIRKARASFRSLSDPLRDTSSAQGRLLSTLLAWIAEFERELIVERARARPKAEGVKFGRKRKLSDYQRAETIKRRGAGETLASIAKSYGVDVDDQPRVVGLAVATLLTRRHRTPYRAALWRLSS